MALTLGTSILGQSLPSPGELSVSPACLTFDDRTRNLQAFVRNTGHREATYRVGLQHLRMRPDGSLEEVETFPASAERMIRFSPKQVTLAAGEQQVIRLQLRRPENLPEGEYRIHLLFRAVPSPGTAVPRAGQDRNIQVRLTPIPGISIPVEVLHGKPLRSFRMDSVTLDTGSQAHVAFDLIRTGKFGLRGKVKALLTQEGSGKEDELGTVAVVHYGDLERQRISFPIRVAAPPMRPLPPGRFRLVLTDDDDHALTELSVPL